MTDSKSSDLGLVGSSPTSGTTLVAEGSFFTYQPLTNFKIQSILITTHRKNIPDGTNRSTKHY
jgi:hypothetical protein